MNMNLNPRGSPESKIDATLRLFAQVQPPENLEQRVHARLQREPGRGNLAGRLRHFFYIQRMVFATVGAALACCAIVVGSVQHSHQHSFSNTGVHIPEAGRGLGAASGTRIAPEPVAVPEHAHARSEQKAEGGRATVSRTAHKPKGVAVPESNNHEKP